MYDSLVGGFNLEVEQGYGLFMTEKMFEYSCSNKSCKISLVHNRNKIYSKRM